MRVNPLYLSVCGALLVANACTYVWAASSDAPPDGGPQGGPPAMSAEFKAAFDACTSQGKPGDSAFESCMTSKGFKKPEGGQRPPSR